MFDIKNCFGLSHDEEITTEKKVGVEELFKSLPTFSLFCTPGHKGELNATDITEFDGGNIFPADSVTVAQNETALFYGVKHARFLVCGASMGVKASILAVDGDIIAPTFTHRSFFEGTTLAKKKAFTFDTGVDGDGLPKVPTALDYERAINANPSAKAIFVTSPDYFGRVAPIKEIKRVADKYGKLLIADCAHGAHYATRPDLFPVGAEKVADFAVLSAHKTLRAYTQSAIGVVNDDDCVGAYDDALNLLGTTSPSYMLLSSLEGAIKYEKANEGVYDDLVKACLCIKNAVPCLRNDDPLRIVVKCNDGKKLFDKLVSEGIMPETYYKNYCIFIVTASTSIQSVEKLGAVLRRLRSE